MTDGRPHDPSTSECPGFVRGFNWWRWRGCIRNAAAILAVSAGLGLLALLCWLVSAPIWLGVIIVMVGGMILALPLAMFADAAGTLFASRFLNEQESILAFAVERYLKNGDDRLVQVLMESEHPMVVPRLNALAQEGSSEATRKAAARLLRQITSGNP